MREQWARMSGGRWTDSVLAFFEAVSTQHRMPMDSKRMIKGVDDFNSTWPACIAAKAASLQGARADRQYLRAIREAGCLDARPIERLEVRGFPTFTIGRGEASARLNGWQPWEVFEDVLRQVDPDLQGKVLEPSERSVVQLLGLSKHWATREIAAVLGVTDDDAELLLEELEGNGKLNRRVVGDGLVWERVPYLPVPP